MKAKFDPDLANAFNFDAADLQANRHGYLSQAQLQHLGHRAHVYAMAGAAFTAVILVPVVGLLFAWMLAREMNIVVMVAILGLVVVVAFMSVRAVFRRMNPAAEITHSAQALTIYEGLFEIRRSEDQERLRIADQWLPIEMKQELYLKRYAGKAARIYYSRPYRKIVSVEIL